MPATTYITRKEAAELSGLSLAAVKNAIDKRIVPAMSHGSQSCVELEDVATFVVLRYIADLSVDEKRRVRSWVRAEQRTEQLELNPILIVRWTAELDDAARRARRYGELRDRWITSDPDVRGGEPVLAGSRVSVYTLADRMQHGEDDATLDEDFPHIPAEARQVAAQFARTHPRRGRPRV